MKIKKKPIRWINTLTLSGVKGALSIIMVHSLPKDFIYLDMFEAIVVGNVILTTFIYTIVLVVYINISKNKFKQDIINDNSSKPKDNNIDFDKIAKSMQKDFDTNAYNKVFIEEILEREIFRSIRYKLELSIIAFKLQNITLFKEDEQKKILNYIGKVVFKKIRANDYFGRIGDNYFIILTTNTSLSGATILANRIEKKFSKFVAEDKNHKLHSSFGIVDTNETDTIETIIEKIEDALKKAKQTHNIQIAY
jgi:CPA1 family monovalent cation:H+ antiporter